MRVYKIFIDLTKEEAWLTGMAKKGYSLIKAGFGYEFAKAEPHDTVVKIDYRIFSKQEDFLNYRTMFEDSGWKHISGNRYTGLQYFKKVSESEGNDIFSDAASRAGRYKRMAGLWVSLAACYLPLLFVFLQSGIIDVKAMLEPKLLYYTPGLWEKTGAEFWRAFLFETPFALLRGFCWLILPTLIALYIIFAVKAHRLYSKTLCGPNS